MRLRHQEFQITQNRALSRTTYARLLVREINRGLLKLGQLLLYLKVNVGALRPF